MLVLRAEGNADADDARRTSIKQVYKLAKSLDGNIEVGEITFTDAAAAVGCSGSEAQCRDDVLGMMGVDELVVDQRDRDAERRRPRHRPPHPEGAASQGRADDRDDGRQSLDAKIAAEIGPMFGVKAKPAPPPSASPPAAKTPTPPPVVTSSTTMGRPATPPPSHGARRTGRRVRQCTGPAPVDASTTNTTRPPSRCAPRRSIRTKP